MARDDEQPGPRGNSRRWEVVLAPKEEDDRSSSTSLTALDVRGDHRVLAHFNPDELAGLELLPDGATLRRYHVYLDLHDPARADFTAEGTETVRPGQRVVARDGTGADLWEALRTACANVVGRRRAG
jgi:hypothetical protein